jgi:hypothetical protein
MRGAVKNTIKILTIEDDPSQTDALKEALSVAQIICVEILETEDADQAMAFPVALFSEEDPTALRNMAFPDNCHLFKRPKTCDEWIYVLRCIEDVWITLLNMAGAPLI